MKLLILGHTIPEPTTTAAGSRMLQIISLFQEDGYEISFATSALPNPQSFDLETIDVTLDTIQLNHPSFDIYISHLSPDIVLFDRFVMEEHYGWRVTQHCPSALKILDTEDLHFLRKSREVSFKKNNDVSDVDLYTDAAKREIASILRCDLSLIISTFEFNLLTQSFHIPQSILYYLPLVVDEVPNKSSMVPWQQREGFMTIGNLFHAPNVDSVVYLKKDIWPLIRQKLPSATLSIYGNYAPQHINGLHNQKEGFLIKGWASSVKEVMGKAKVCLAPLRFGAGIKGKLLDAMLFGTPAVTTRIGSESMYGDQETIFMAENTEDIVDKSVSLYTDEDHWNRSQFAGIEVIRKNYLKTIYAHKVVSKVRSILDNLKAHREHHFFGQILQHQSMQATKYMSRWIEIKNKK